MGGALPGASKLGPHAASDVQPCGRRIASNTMPLVPFRSGSPGPACESAPRVSTWDILWPWVYPMANRPKMILLCELYGPMPYIAPTTSFDISLSSVPRTLWTCLTSLPKRAFQGMLWPPIVLTLGGSMHAVFQDLPLLQVSFWVKFGMMIFLIKPLGCHSGADLGISSAWVHLSASFDSKRKLRGCLLSIPFSNFHGIAYACGVVLVTLPASNGSPSPQSWWPPRAALFYFRTLSLGRGSTKSRDLPHAVCWAHLSFGWSEKAVEQTCWGENVC